MKRYNDQNHHVVAEETGFGLAKTNGQLHPGAETPRDSKSALHPVVWKAAQAEPSGSIASTHTSPVKTVTAGFHLAPEHPLV